MALELGSNEAIKAAILRGAGVAVLSEWAVRADLAAGRLAAVDVRGLRCDREMYVARDRRRLPSRPARLFLALLDSHSAPDLAP